MNKHVFDFNAPRLSELKNAADFLEKRVDYLFAIDEYNGAREADCHITPMSIKATIESTLFSTIIEVYFAGKKAEEITDDMLKEYLEGHLKEKSESSLASNKERLKRIHINMDIEDASERILDIWQQWVTLRTGLCLEDLLRLMIERNSGWER